MDVTNTKKVIVRNAMHVLRKWIQSLNTHKKKHWKSSLRESDKKTADNGKVSDLSGTASDDSNTGSSGSGSSSSSDSGSSPSLDNGDGEQPKKQF